MNLKVWYITNGEKDEQDQLYLAPHRAQVWITARSNAAMFLNEAEALGVAQKYPGAEVRVHEVKPLPTPHSIDESFANIVELLETLRERARGLSADNVDLGGRLGKAETQRDVALREVRAKQALAHQLQKENESLRKQRDDFFGAYNDLCELVGLGRIPESYRHLLPKTRQQTFTTVEQLVKIRESKEGLRAQVRRLERQRGSLLREKEDLLRENARLAQSAVTVTVNESPRATSLHVSEPPAVPTIPEPREVSASRFPQSVQDVLHFLRTGGRYFSGATCADVLERKGIVSRLDILD